MIIRSVLMHRCGGSEGCVGSTRKRGGMYVYICVHGRGGSN